LLAIYTLAAVAAPVVHITSPKPRTVLMGTVRVFANMSDETEFGYAMLSINTQGRSISNALPIHFLIDTTQYPNGQHTLQVDIFDKAGLIASSPGVPVFIANPTADGQPPVIPQLVVPAKPKTTPPAKPAPAKPNTKPAKPVVPSTTTAKAPAKPSLGKPTTIAKTAPNVPAASAPTLTARTSVNPGSPKPAASTLPTKAVPGITVAKLPTTDIIARTGSTGLVPDAGPIGTYAPGTVIYSRPPVPLSLPELPTLGRTTVSSGAPKPAATTLPGKSTPVRTTPDAAPATVAATGTTGGVQPSLPTVAKPTTTAVRDNMKLAATTPNVTANSPAGTRLTAAVPNAPKTTHAPVKSAPASTSPTLPPAVEIAAPRVVPAPVVADLATTRIVVTLDGQPVDMLYPPKEIKGHMLVMIRPVITALGGTVTWDHRKHAAIATVDDKVAVFTMNRDAAFCNGQMVSLDYLVRAYNDRMFVPATVVSQIFGGSVAFNPVNKKLYVRSHNALVRAKLCAK
jgi:hypothetical protein